MPVIPATVDLDRLNRRYQALQLRLAALQGRAKELQGRKTTLTREIALAKGRQELAPQAMEVFNYLQEKAHSRAVGQFEDLLSAFVSDVIPDAGAIRLEVGTERGSPSLDILLDNGGDLENILEGNGGGLTNVVVVGLGYAALSRTRNRQLMVLDEPDCWLKAVNVPAFTKVIAEVANPRTEDSGEVHVGCQTLMVSHNDIALMDDGAHIQDLRTEKDLAAFAHRQGVPVVHVGTPGPCAYVVWVDGGLRGRHKIEVRYRDDGQGDDEHNALTKGYPYLEAISGARPWADTTQPGVRWVEVSNLRRHVRTHMDLSSGLNVLTGGVNGGKSTLYFTALRAMAYGESDDTMIRHGADEMTIRLGLENGVVLELVRKRKGSPKAVYRRYQDGKLIHEGRQESRGGVPAFIADVLAINRVDDLDIQLRSQKQPVFLLNESASRRAQLLSVGRESGLLQELIERHRIQVRRDKEQLKRDEIELNQVNRTLTVMAPVASMSALVEIMNGLFEEAKKSTGSLTALRSLVSTLKPLASRKALGDALGTKLDQPLVTPSCSDTRSLSALVSVLGKTESATRIPALPELPSLPELAPGTGLSALIQNLQRWGLAGQVAALLPLTPATPEVVSTAELRKTGVGLASSKETVSAAEKELATASDEFKKGEEALRALRQEMGACPVCNKPFEDHDHV